MLDAVQTSALARAVPERAEKVARRALGVGVHPVDVTVRIRGTLTVGEPGERTPTTSIPVKEVLALLLQRSGALRASNAQLLLDCLTEALQAGPEARGALVGEFDAEFGRQVDELLAKLPKAPSAGQCRAKLAVELVPASAS